ncbi:hypothetical protein BHE74_00038984, partial [Ensete ventricosum]
FIDNILLDTKYSYTIETYQLINICPKSFSFPLPQPSFKHFSKWNANLKNLYINRVSYKAQ